MNGPGKISDVIVNYRAMKRMTETNEAAVTKAVAEKANKLGDPWQQAAILARIGKALREMEDTENRNGDPEVLVSPPDALASRMQSTMAERGTGFNPLPSGGKELKFDTITDPFGWALSWLTEWSDDKHDLMRPASTSADPFPNTARLAVLGDWGTGLYGAPVSAKTIQNDTNKYTMLLHLGDVYYAGAPKEEQQRFLDLWPKRREAFTRALNSNHEMYSGGQSYFGSVLPAFGQSSSYFALRNNNWTLIGLDSAYVDFDMDETQVHWLEDVVAQSDSTKIVLFSHHQLFSQLDAQGTNLAVRLSKLLQQQKIRLWYWGHEHRCVLYEEYAALKLTARCIGHGGMPQRRGSERDAPAEGQTGDAIWRRLPSKPGIPSALVLDGRNACIKGKEDTYSPHGYITLEFDGPHLHETVFLPDGTKVREQDFT
jgi:hypothetical protein